MSPNLVSAFLLVLSSAQAAHLRLPADVGTGGTGLAKVVENMNGQLSKIVEQTKTLAVATAVEQTKRSADLTTALAHHAQTQKELKALGGSLVQKPAEPEATGLAKIVENMNGQLSKIAEQTQNLAVATAAEHTKRNAVLTNALAHQAQTKKQLNALKGSLVQKPEPEATGLAKVVENMNGQLSKMAEQAQNLAVATAVEHTKRNAVLTNALAHQAQTKKELNALKGSLVQKPAEPEATGLAKVVENMNQQLSKIAEQTQNLAVATAVEHTKRNAVLTNALAHQAQTKKELEALK